MKLYQAERLKKVAGGRTILDIRYLEIEAGRIYGLLGANGAGKTTLLNILAFLDQPTSGVLEFAGKPVRSSGVSLKKLRREVVMVDQHPVLFSTSVYKNIEFGLKVRNIPSVQRRSIICEVLKKVGMTDFTYEPARRLSGGETQRVALARALALSPRVLLCDEPTSSVDAENQSAIIKILREINEVNGISIIFTSHDRLQAAGLAHRSLVLENGSLATAGHENIFTCTVSQPFSGKVLCRLLDSVDLFLPAGQVKFGPETTKLSLDPSKITLLQSAPERDALGIVDGEVVQLTVEGDRIRMHVNAGVMLTVMLTRKDYREVHPAVGERVVLQVMPEAVVL